MGHKKKHVVTIHFKDGTSLWFNVASTTRQEIATDFANFVNTDRSLPVTRAVTYEASDDTTASIMVTLDFSLIKLIA